MLPSCHCRIEPGMDLMFVNVLLPPPGSTLPADFRHDLRRGSIFAVRDSTQMLEYLSGMGSRSPPGMGEDLALVGGKIQTFQMFHDVGGTVALYPSSHGILLFATIRDGPMPAATDPGYPPAVQKDCTRETKKASESRLCSQIIGGNRTGKDSRIDASGKHPPLILLRPSAGSSRRTTHSGTETKNP